MRRGERYDPQRDIALIMKWLMAMDEKLDRILDAVEGGDDEQEEDL
jgi:hypothetical protein